MMKKTTVALLGATILIAFGCVGKKVFNTEKTTRIAVENREKVLVQEMLDRKKEAAELIKKVGDLNRTIGNQESEIKELEQEIVARTQSMGASTSKLSTEKANLEKQLATTNELLEQKNDVLSRIKNVQTKRKSILLELEASLKKALEPSMASGVTVMVAEQAVSVLAPDKALFEPSGLAISANGRTFLTLLAEFLAARPELDVDVIAYTDNALPPKEKTLKDTWEWSLQRSSIIVRTMSKELNTNANQLSPIGRGEFYPLTSNETPEGRAQNRRTEFVFHPVLPAIPSADE
ncbi:MAG: OmpA family protein [Saprospiraceae bacterium]|nr:OmpA family protein [Saprospiraceae bacterium]